MNLKTAYALLTVLILSVIALDVTAYIDHYERQKPRGLTVEGFTARLFISDDCPECEQAAWFLDSVRGDYPSMEISIHNIDDSEEEEELLETTAASLGLAGKPIPLFIVENNFFRGFVVCAKEETHEDMVSIIEQAHGRVPETGERTDFILFWRQGCPHCLQERTELIPYLAEKYACMSVALYDVDKKEAIDVLINLSRDLGFDASGVPVTVVGSEHVIGYGDLASTGSHIEGLVSRVNQTVTHARHATENIPLLGEVNLREVSLPVFTMVLGLVDGFNPCAFFVLCFLLTLLVYAKSRRKMLAVGLTFIFISAFVYFLFMAAWLTFFQISSGVGLVTVAGGIVALLLGIVNFKEFFFMGAGEVSTTISDEHKKDLFSRMRGLLKSETFAQIMIGTIVLAVVANTYELLCTVGLPMVYTRTLTMHGLDTLTYYLYLAMYNVFYVLPLLTIVVGFAWTFGAKKMCKSTGELLKLISGLMMLRFGITLIVAPDLMTNLFFTVTLIATSVIVGLLGWKMKKMIILKMVGYEDETAERPEV